MMKYLMMKMKKIVFAAVALVMLAGCTNKGEKMLAQLNERGIGMLVCNEGVTTEYNAPGVQDLLRLTAQEPERLQGAVVADKRVGKAAASLQIEGGVNEVYTNLVSTPAREMLEKAGISLYAAEEIPLMVNMDGTDLCPMESKLLEANTAQECTAILRNDPMWGRQMLDILNEQSLSLLVYNEGSLTSHDNRGVKDLLQLLEQQPERLKGAVVADKLIGKAAASLMVAGGVKAVYTNTISTPAREMLEQAGASVFAHQEIPMVLNRDGSAQCPFDAKLNEAKTAEECVAILRALP